MTFTKTLNTLMFSYYLGNYIVLRCDQFVMDLGFKLTSNLDPSVHIEIIYRKALKNLALS